MRRNAVFCLNSVCFYTTVFRPVPVWVGKALIIVALAGLDEKQFGFSSHREAFCSNKRFHQHPDVDGVAVHAIHAPLAAMAENTTHHAVPLSLASAGQFLHQGQHLSARTVLMNLHLKAKPAKDFTQRL